MKTNIEIVESIVDAEDWFGGNAYVEKCREKEVQISTTAVFVRMNDLECLKKHIESYKKIKDIEVSPMPGRDYALAVTIIF